MKVSSQINDRSCKPSKAERQYRPSALCKSHLADQGSLWYSFSGNKTFTMFISGINLKILLPQRELLSVAPIRMAFDSLVVRSVPGFSIVKPVHPSQLSLQVDTPEEKHHRIGV